jgi:sugar phosphate isomerase/epimerase
MEPLHVHIPYPKLRDYFVLIQKRRYDLEIYFPAAVLDQLEKADVEALRTSLDWNPALTLHAPFMDLNAGAVDTMVRSVTQLRFRQVLDVAAILKPRAVVFHAGYDRWRYAGRKDIWLDNGLPVWKGLVEMASKFGVRLAVENVFDEDPDALAMLIDAVGSPDFGLCFDTGHFNLFSKVALEEWFKAIGDRVVELHLHDNAGNEDSHLALGKGTFDFDLFFGLLRQHGVRPVYTIEAHDKDDVGVSIERVRTYLAELH